jgi:IS5 family transposase
MDRSSSAAIRGAEAMLMYLLQVMFGLSDEGTEDARQTCTSTSSRTPHPREEGPHARRAELGARGGGRHDAGRLHRGRDLHRGAELSRDPEAHQSKKGKNWHFGFKAHIGVDAGSGLVHTVETTAANVSDRGLRIHRGGEAPRGRLRPAPLIDAVDRRQEASTVKGLDCALSAEKVRSRWSTPSSSCYRGIEKKFALSNLAMCISGCRRLPDPAGQPSH